MTISVEVTLLLALSNNGSPLALFNTDDDRSCFLVEIHCQPNFKDSLKLDELKNGLTNRSSYSGVVGISEANGAMGENNDFAITTTKIISHLVSFKRQNFLLTEGIAPINMADDVDLYLKLEEVGDILFVDKPLHYYRIDNSISSARTVSKTNSDFITSNVFLNAYNRRISSNSPLFRSKKIDTIQP